MAGHHQIRSAMAIAAQAGVNVLLWGPAGVGKTATITGLADDLNLHLEVLIGSIRDATDIGGLPYRCDEGVALAPPAWATRIVASHAEGRRSLLLIDELTTCPPAVQAALLRVVLERVTGDLALPDDTVVVAAANPADLAADGYDLAPPLANRFCHLEWPTDAGAWCDGMVSGWTTNRTGAPVLPESWVDHIPGWRARIAGFIQHRSALLHHMPEDIEAQGRAWPSPRSWDAAARAMAAATAADPEGGAITDLLVGCVGDGPASELLAWLATADLPDPTAVLLNPACLDLPMRGDRLLAVLGGVVAEVAAVPDESFWEAAWQVLSRAADAGQGDVAAVVARPLLALRQEGWALPAAIEAFAPLLRAAGAAA